MKKTLSFLLAFCMLVTFCVCSFDLPVFVYAASVSDSDIFVKQSRSGRCTLASAVMMLRRRAVIDGFDDWKDISEDSLASIAWTDAGLYNNFTYGDTIVGYAALSGTVEEKKNQLISLLKIHPEGIEVYNCDGEKVHAVLVTDYSEGDDAFYCADPAAGIEFGRIPLTSAWLPGTTQEERIENLDYYWYITNKSGGSLADYISGGIISNTNQTLKNGDMNNSVKELQLALNKVLNSGLEIDGHFGPLTETAVMSFQTQYELTVDGIAGQDSLKILNELYGDHTHEFKKEYEALHPHKEFRYCDCGFYAYTPKTYTIENCNECIEAEKEKQIIFTIGEKNATVFGVEMENDVAPVIVNDRAMLPARFISENLGADISWQPGQWGSVKISRNGVEALLHIGAETAYVNGNSVSLDSPAYIDNDRVYIPVRFIAEVLDAKVAWNSETKQVVITK